MLGWLVGWLAVGWLVGWLLGWVGLDWVNWVGGSVRLCVCLCVCLCVSVSLWLSVCQSVCPSVRLSVCLLIPWIQGLILFLFFHGEFVSVSTITVGIYYGLVQERHNSIADTLELRLSCTNPSIWDQHDRTQGSCGHQPAKRAFHVQKLWMYCMKNNWYLP